jgi:DNA replication protein DnaC
MSLVSVPMPLICARCDGSGWLPVPGDSLRVEPCGCQGDLRRRQRILAANIPKRYAHCTLDSFADRTADQRVAKLRVQEFVDSWPASQGLLLIGKCGVGKTHLAVAAISEIIRSNKPGRLIFSNFQDLIQEIQASFNNDQVPSKSELLRPLLEADLLVLDELGSQKPTQFIQDILYYLINTRYNEERTTIFTTNYPEKAEPKDESLSDRIGTRLRSRLYEMAYLVPISGEDHRRNALKS